MRGSRSCAEILGSHQHRSIKPWFQYAQAKWQHGIMCDTSWYGTEKKVDRAHVGGALGANRWGLHVGFRQVSLLRTEAPAHSILIVWQNSFDPSTVRLLTG